MCVVITHETLLPSTETVEGHRYGNRNIDADHSYLNTVRKLARHLSIPREDGRAVAEFMLIHQLQGTGEIGNTNDT